ncbi:hypothetical protein MKW94_028845 [Papaver nudicaule]|uniref:RRM domain-containing protein n=1 Tax=Papaver nudicaule TaxID=74823 RepID=A0AA41VW82_PAPNU|nr:hypothetical protein [Papaver nudicaule]
MEEASISNTLLESDFEETKVLENLIDAFRSTFSLREIASAYCKAGRDPDLAAQILYDNCSDATSALSTTQSGGTSSDSSLWGSVANKPDGGGTGSKLKEVASSVGSSVSYASVAASSVLSTTQSGGTSSDSSMCGSVANKPDRGADDSGSKLTEPAFSVGSRVSYAAAVAASVPTTAQCGTTSDSFLCDSVANQPNAGADHKGSKPTEVASSVGSSVSASFVGGGYYAMRNTPACCLICGPKPLKGDAQDIPVDELIDEEDQMHTDPFVAGKVFGRMVEVNKAVPRGELNNRYNKKGLNKSNGNNGQFRRKRIFVGGLPPSVTEEGLKAYFEKFGRTTDVVVIYKSTTQQPKGFGYVTFDSEESVENVMQERFHELSGKVVGVEIALPKDGSNNGHSGGKGYAMHNTPAYGPVSAYDELTDDDDTSDSSVEDYQKHTDRSVAGKFLSKGEYNNPYYQKGFNKSNGNDGQFRTKKIFVGGLPFGSTEEEFKAYFEKFGRATEVVISKGFGFITFDSEEAVENVTQRRFHELNGKAVEVKKFVPKQGNNNGHSGSYNMRMRGGRGGHHMGGYGAVGYGGTPIVSPVSPRSPL